MLSYHGSMYGGAGRQGKIIRRCWVNFVNAPMLELELRFSIDI